MMGLFQTPSAGICADSLRVWPWFCLLLLSGLTWFLPLSPAVNTLESKPRPPFTVEVEAEKINTTQTDNYLEEALKAAGCNSGISAFGQDCSLLKKTLGTMNTHILQGQREDVEEYGKKEDFPWNRDPDTLPELQVNCWCPAQCLSPHRSPTQTGSVGIKSIGASEVSAKIFSLEIRSILLGLSIFCKKRIQSWKIL